MAASGEPLHGGFEFSWIFVLVVEKLQFSLSFGVRNLTYFLSRWALLKTIMNLQSVLKIAGFLALGSHDLCASQYAPEFKFNSGV